MRSLCRAARLEVPLARSLALVACLMLAACGGEDEVIAPPPPLVASVDVTPQTATIAALGWRVQLSAIARDSSGSAIPGAVVQWSSSARSVATVDSVGLVTAVGNGSAEIKASADGASGTATIVVRQEPTHLEFVSPPTVAMVGDTITPAVEVAIKDLGGATVADATDTVSVAIGASPAGAVLAGTTTLGAVGGVASFTDLTIDREGSGYTLAATAPRLHRASSPAFDIWNSLTRVDSVKLLQQPQHSSDTLYIDRFRVAYAVSVSSIAGSTMSAVTLRGYIDQGAASRAAGWTPVVCTAVIGDLPQGTCAFNLIVGASNTTAGTGTLVPGDATARFELRDGISDTLLYRLTRPVTLIEDAEPRLWRARIDSVVLSSTSLTIGGPPVSYTATETNEESAILVRIVFQGWIDQGFASHSGGATWSGYSNFPPGTYSFDFTLDVSNTLVAGPATARFELRDYANQRVLDTFFVPVTLHW
jgi:hypothetical protein